MKTQDDIELDFIDLGQGEPVCLLIHGFGDNAGVWTNFANRIKTKRRLIIPDLRGHGRSAWSENKGYQTSDYARDISLLVRRLSLENIDLIGHSLGAEICTYLAHEHQKTVRRLVLVDFGPEVKSDARQRIRKDFNDGPRSFPSVNDYVDWLAQLRPFAEISLLRNIAERGSHLMADGSARLLADPAIGSPEQSRPRLLKGEISIDLQLRRTASGISAPVLLLRGIGSSVLPADAAERFTLYGLLNGTLKNVPAAGHNVMLDAPEQFFETVAPFLLN